MRNILTNEEVPAVNLNVYISKSIALRVRSEILRIFLNLFLLDAR